jgi:hypothetical protein
MSTRFADTVIGSVVDLTFTVRDRATRALVDLEAASAAATCKIIDPDGGVVVAAGALTFAGTVGSYRFDTAGQAAGMHRVQVTFSSGLTPSPLINPAAPITIRLVAPI